MTTQQQIDQIEAAIARCRRNSLITCVIAIAVPVVVAICQLAKLL